MNPRQRACLARRAARVLAALRHYNLPQGSIATDGFDSPSLSASSVHFSLPPVRAAGASVTC